MLIIIFQNYGKEIVLKANLSETITYFPFALVKCDFEKYRDAFALISFNEKLGSRNSDRTTKYTGVREHFPMKPESDNHPQCTNVGCHPSAMGGVLR